MKVQELIKKIHDDYPEVYREFVLWYYPYLKNIKNVYLWAKTEDQEEIILDHYMYFEQDRKNICYCELEDFFEENGIRINIFFGSRLKRKNKWSYEIVSIGDSFDIFEKWNIKTKNEAKEQAILKACETMVGY